MTRAVAEAVRISRTGRCTRDASEQPISACTHRITAAPKTSTVPVLRLVFEVIDADKRHCLVD